MRRMTGRYWPFCGLCRVTNVLLRDVLKDNDKETACAILS